MYNHLDYPFHSDAAPPIQLHTIGMSLVNSLCSELVVSVYKENNVYRMVYTHGRLSKEESRENPDNTTGTSVEGKIDPDLLPVEMDREKDKQDIEQWLKAIQSANQTLKLFFNGKELQ